MQAACRLENSRCRSRLGGALCKMQKKILVGSFYIPPNCTINNFDLMKESFHRACNTSISDIIITGDFNFNMAQNAPNKMSKLILEYNLTQLISEPMHITETSSSILYLILVRNKNNVLLSGVADPFIPNQIRYHSPVIVLLKFTHPITQFSRDGSCTIN